ncbi:MAG: immunoglobulin-like domain-containing protein [Bacilli bacterium]|jgi:peptidoglycan/xylan/chitin deacetylase (PgdA/CDA1 family)
MKKSILKKIILFVVTLIFLFGAYYFILKPKVELIGDDIILITVNEEYLEPGIKARNLNKDISDKVQVIGEVNPNKLGTYKLTYKVKSNFISTTVIRTIKVVDDKAPVIELISGDNITICPNARYVEPGYSAIDNFDGVLTDKVSVVNETDKVIYKVKDQSNNEVVIVRTITRADNDKPIITLKGSATTQIIIGNKYYESGYTATDSCDGDLTKKVKVTNNVKFNKLGTYSVTYEVSDSNGNTTIVTRTVKVVNPTPPKNSTIYLTFDDGPSSITPLVLDILKEEGVKATFFVLNKNSSYDYLLERIVNEGHTIALHGYSHNYSTIYASVDAFFNNLTAIQNKVKNITGVTSNIIRFPGGSSNKVSSFNPGIMTILAQEVTDRGYRYYDWNVSSADTTDCSSSQVYQNVVNGIKNSKNSTLVVLMHDYEGNYKTVNALRDIIRYGKNNGYKFDRITESTPQIKHKINN